MKRLKAEVVVSDVYSVRVGAKRAKLGLELHPLHKKRHIYDRRQD